MQTVIVIAVNLTLPRTLRATAAAVLLAAPFALVACSSSGSGSGTETASSTSAAAAGDCPTTPLNVVVSVDQWGDIVSDLGGACAKVTTVLASSSVDPHDYEPSPSDAAKFAGAQLVVINGGHYDEWAAKLAASSAASAPVVNAIELDRGEGAGVNPHAWYRPATVTAVADAVTAKLSDLAPAAKDYFQERHSAFTDQMKPYTQLIDTIKAKSAGKTYAATETVFDDMAGALGLSDRTPEGYQVASSNETDPSPADLDAFLRLLGDKGVDVLIYNTQTEGSVPEQIRAAAEKAGVPVVEVTETVAPGAKSFEAWQVDQLTALAKALQIQT